jgi:predicted SAM-dependent methyltransferase
MDPLTIRRYLASHPVRKLQIGAGPNPLAGWLNSDVSPDDHPHSHGDEITFLDAAKRFPFEDATFDYVLSEHMIEHLSEAGAHVMLAECFRVLRPGGRIRIATPNLAAIVGIYEDPLSDLQRHYVDWVMTTFRPEVRGGNPRCYVMNQMFTAYGHRFIYDHETLTLMITAAGFSDVAHYRPGQSDDPALRGVERHGQLLGDEDVNNFETMVLEATRPVADASPTGRHA